jgi:Protein of unknown function (DUF2851)
VTTRLANAPRKGFRVANFEFPSLHERELARLWQDQTFPADALTTGEGEKLRVIYRGRSGGGAGPDFRDALIATRGGLRRGDVELHVRSSDFRRHRHHLDPAYAGVVLHVVFWDDERRPTILPGGAAAPVAALAGWVAGRAAEIARWLERPALWREPCFTAVTREGAAGVGATLDRLGDMRFRRKTATLAALIGDVGEEEALWQSLLEALAFGPDRQAFRLVAQQVAWLPLRARLRSLPSSQRVTEARSSLEAEFARRALPGRATRRPANRPVLRLEGAARLAARFAEKGLVESLRGALQGETAHHSSEESQLEKAKMEKQRKRDEERFPVGGFEFRSRRQPRRERLSVSSLVSTLTVPGLIGRSRALEVIANAVLPGLAALGPEVRARRAEAVFACLPLPARYGSVRHLHEAVGGVTLGEFREQKGGLAAVPIDFRRQQGMIYLLNEYCTQGGCGNCPLS